jgi:rubrerythrin
MSTQENLKAAFAGESQANRKYLAFAKKAEADGKPGVAKLFRAAAEAETVHAHAHLRAMKGIGSTAENLQAAIEGEGYEYTKMYPPFLAEAEKEKQMAAVVSFKNAMAVEKVHHDLYSQAAEAVKAGQDFDAQSIYVCSVCGHTVVNGIPDKCPVCGVAHDKFFEVK